MSKLILLGASRGLGLAFTKLCDQHQQEYQQYSRSSSPPMDFAKEEAWLSYMELLKQQSPERLIYFAGGGPHGPFEQKNWKDHQWAWRVSFLFPAFLLHQMLKTELKQLVFVGSSIAENQPDLNAASYCAAKHALRGLLTSVQLENPKLDLRLFSPGYLDTDLLPRDAWPRRQGLAQEPALIASQLWSWLESYVEPSHRHLVLKGVKSSQSC